MGGIDRITAIHPPRSNDANRWGVVLHVANLHWRRVGSQQQIPLQIKRVLHIPCRMVFRDIEGREVVVVLLHFRAFRHAVPQSQEEIDDLFSC